MLNRLAKIVIFLPAVAYAMEPQKPPQNGFLHVFGYPDFSEVKETDIGATILNAVMGHPKKETPDLEKAIILWAKIDRPQIVLHAEQESVSNDLKKYKLMGRTEQVITPEQLQRNKKITIKITSDNSISIHTEFFLTSNNKPSNVPSTNSEFTLDGNTPTCLKADKQGKRVYIGCADGMIRIYDMELEIVHETKIFHSLAIEAIDLLDDDQVIITKAGKETFLTSVYDSHSRIALEQVDHSQTYLCKRGIIRSHMGGKGVFSSYIGTVASNDGVYEVPTAYLHGEEPGNNVRKCMLLFLMQRLAEQNIDKDFIREQCPKIANLAVLNTFEPALTKTFKELLKKIGGNNFTFCGDTTFAPLQE